MAAQRDTGTGAGTDVVVATSQQAWGEALAALLTSRDVPAVALDPAGRPWSGDAVPPQWRVLVVDGADAGAGDIVARLDAEARVGISGQGHPPIAGIDVWVSVDDARRLVAAVHDPRAAARTRTTHRGSHARGALTARERTVLAALREGLSNADIAGRLDVSPHTVRTHVHNILGKLGARNRLEAAVMARAATASDAEVSR